MRKLNYKLAYIAFLAAVVMSSSFAIFKAAQAQSAFNFVRDLTVGSNGDDVKALQQFLNSHGAQISANGPGSLGSETPYFGRGTRTALARWQAANGVLPAVGYFGPKTRLAMAAIAEKTARPSLAPIPAPAVGSRNPRQESPGLPVRLRIPNINVDAPVIQVGITPDGAMGVPKGPAEVAWFSLGTRPGEIGSAVVSGHFGPWKTGEGSVFDNLNKLKNGDKLYIEDDRGAIITFVVRESRLYDPKADSSGVFGSSDGKAHLNVVTCEGIWDKVNKTYSNRLVVFADKE